MIPAITPPPAGYLGKSRRRISASGLVTWERCPRQWHFRRRIGISDATSPEMVIGLVVEDALCGHLMERLPKIGDKFEIRSNWVDFNRTKDGLDPIDEGEGDEFTDLESLRQWCDKIVSLLTSEVLRELNSRWDAKPWKAHGRSMDEIDEERIRPLLEGGIELQLEEVVACLEQGGGPLLGNFRDSGDPFSVPAPCWEEEPVAPGEAANRNSDGFSEEGAVTLWEAWEVTRPWVKDPRIDSPQRLFHPKGWAAGEMDLVLRWTGDTRICDVKSSAGTSGYSAGLASQLWFYQWLWNVTRDSTGRVEGSVSEGTVTALEGWYLKGPHRKVVEVMPPGEEAVEAKRWEAIHEQMTLSGLHPSHLAPADPAVWVSHAPGGKALAIEDEAAAKSETCRRCTGAAFCDAAPLEVRERALNRLLPESMTSSEGFVQSLAPKSPCIPIGSIPTRLDVKGMLKGHWGPMPNHYGEPVRGAVLTVGSKNIIVEEMGAESFGELPESGEYVLRDVAPGIWRRMPRIYLDEHSTIIPLEESEGIETTRLGLIQTKASVSGLVVSRGGNSGINARGKPWSMESCHLWDGENLIEVVAFGSAIGMTFTSLRVGDRLRVLSGELGWRDGVPQIRIDARSTRLEVE